MSRGGGGLDENAMGNTTVIHTIQKSIVSHKAVGQIHYNIHLYKFLLCHTYYTHSFVNPVQYHPEILQYIYKGDLPIFNSFELRVLNAKMTEHIKIQC